MLCIQWEVFTLVLRGFVHRYMLMYELLALLYLMMYCEWCIYNGRSLYVDSS